MEKSAQLEAVLPAEVPQRNEFLSSQALAVMHDELMRICGGRIDVTWMTPKIVNGYSEPNEATGKAGLLLRMKIGVFVRLLEWEIEEIRQFFRTPLPSAVAVLGDIIGTIVGNDERFPLDKLIAKILFIRLGEMAWEKLPASRAGALAEVVVWGDQDDDVMEQLAMILWKHRHLGRSSDE